MKTLIHICFFLFSFVAVAQTSNRIIVNGEVKVPAGEDPEGIAVVNKTALKATVTGSDGLFQIPVKKGDTLEFTSLQFQDFKIIVDAGIIKTGKMNVFVNEAVNVLPEVVVTPYDLSGNVRVDVEIIPVVRPDLPTQTAAEINPYTHEFRPDSLVSPQNPAMRTGMIYSGANFANVFRHIFSKRNVLNDLDREEQLNEKLMQLRDDSFYKEQLNLEEDELKPFFYFAAEQGLTEDMLEPKNELKLIEFLVAQSQKFKQQKN